MVKRIACFFTCAYAESGGIQSFLRRINNTYDFQQCLPNKTIKKKGSPKIINQSINGLTGTKLLDKVCDILSKKSEDYSLFDGILVEDDLDDRFYGISDEEISDYCSNIVNNIRLAVGVVDIPVYILFAAPELESWFIADWNNGFKYLCTKSNVFDDVSLAGREYFAIHLKKYIENRILADKKDCIERFGHVNGCYVKLSEKIQEAFAYEVKNELSKIPTTHIITEILESRKIRYSKKLHGEIMLKNINPTVVAEKCPLYFRAAYHSLVEIN